MSDSTLPAIPADWLPDEVLRRTGAEAADARSPQDWIPPGLPESAPATPRRKRSSGQHQIPPGMQPPSATAVPARDDELMQQLRRERDDLAREQRDLRRSLERISAELAAARGDTGVPPPPAPTSPPEPIPEPAPGEPVNINTAPIEQLVRLPGVGRRAAERIVEYREEHGPFASVQALVHVPGFHPDRITRFIDQATV